MIISSPHRYWRIWRIMPLTEAAYPIRLYLAPIKLAVEVFLYYRIWTALYSHTKSMAGMDVGQTVSYSTLALLVAHIRSSARVYSKDSVAAHVREGTIIYWFLRPIPPHMYCLIRGLGDMGYGALWALLGYALAITFSIIQVPHSVGLRLTFTVSLVLGQIILYYLHEIVDLFMFWGTSNDGVVRMYYFAQDLLSGVYIPLWFMPSSLLTVVKIMPFSAAINTPISLYVGRIPIHDALGQLALQGMWIILLILLARFLWRRASDRVTSQGG